MTRDMKEIMSLHCDEEESEEIAEYWDEASGKALDPELVKA